VNGVRGTAHKWFVSYLKNRMQMVEIDYLDTTDEIQHTLSEERIIQYGVPQGSILGLLFSSRLRLFADDTSILITGKNVNELASILDTINSIIS
jgi:hypothetical protein